MEYVGNIVSSLKAKPNGSAGFTILELSIATSVFSIVLLVALASFLGIGKIFYKGVTITQTQDATQAVLNQITSDLQFATSVVPAQDAGSSKYICLGSVRYTYNLFKKVDLEVHDNTSNFGLLRDVLPGNSGCAAPFGTGATAFSNPTELLGNRMRLSKLDIIPAKNSSGGDVTDLWAINLTTAYGEDGYLQSGDTATPICNSNLNNSQFCTVVTVNNSVNRGL
jgi:prepilin-type N-terminal cleavage/methylation domain-containing protein